MTTTDHQQASLRRQILLRDVRAASVAIRHAAEQLGPCPGGVQLTEDQAEEAIGHMLRAAVAAVGAVVDGGLVNEETLDEIEGALTAYEANRGEAGIPQLG